MANANDLNREFQSGLRAGLRAGQKVDWRRVWKEFETWWTEETVGSTDWPRQKKKIQSLAKKYSGNLPPCCTKRSPV